MLSPHRQRQINDGNNLHMACEPSLHAMGNRRGTLPFHTLCSCLSQIIIRNHSNRKSLSMTWGLRERACADLGRAESALTALATNPKAIAISYLSRLATDRDSWGPGRPLDGSLYNYTLSFAQAPSVSTSWR